MHDDFEDIGIERDTRSREEREIEALNGFLARHYWSTVSDEDGISAAAYVIAGVDPDRTMGSVDYRGWAFLPGGLASFGWDEYPKDPHDLQLLSDGIHSHARTITAILRTHGPDRPEVLVRLAMGRGITVPWIAHAPQLLSEAQAAETKKTRMSLAQSKRATERHARDDRRVALEKVGRPLFDEWLSRAEDIGISKSALADQILDAFMDTFPDFEFHSKRTVLRRIDQWIEEAGADAAA